MADFSVGTEDWTESSQGQAEKLRRQLAEASKSSGICRTRWQEPAARTKEYMETERLHPEEARTAPEALKSCRHRGAADEGIREGAPNGALNRVRFKNERIWV